MLLFQSCGVEAKITFVTEAGIRICNIDCPKCDMVLRMSYSSNENTGKLSYTISNFKSHFFSKHGDDISTASSDHDSIISDISFPDTTITPATPSILSQRSRKHSVQRSGQRSDPRACDSCESLQRILIKKDNELAEYVNRLKMLNHLESTISEKGKIRKFVLRFIIFTN